MSRTVAHGLLRYPELMRLLLSVLKYITALIVGLLLLWFGLMATGNWQQPYGSDMRALSWHLGWQERAYNLGEVVPGRIYRSGKPDARFIDYLQQEYGVERIIALNARKPHAYHRHAQERGMALHFFGWTSKQVPPDEKLRAVLKLLRDSEVPVLVHCAAGKDRTGYAIASYRILEQGWPLEQALEEMRRHWHDEHKRPWFFAALKRRNH